jgi:hypothetical protein
MAVDLTTSPGGLFRRLGKIGYAINSINTFNGTGDLSAGGVRSVGVLTDNVQDQFESSRQDLTQQLYSQRDSYRGAHGAYKSYLRTLAQNTLIEMVNDDTRLPQKTLTLALTELIAQMVSGSASVTRPTTSATVTAGSGNTGTGVCAASLTNKYGAPLDYVFAETLTLKATADSQSATATASSEPFSYTGAAQQSDALAWDWPLGSAAQGSLTAIDAALNNSGNVLQNSSFATFTTANAPDNWPVAVGSVGTAILQATGSNAYKGSSGLALVGDASVLHSLSQPFNTSPSTSLGAGGTSYRLKPSMVYAVNLWHKVSDAAATGTVTLSLVDGSGTVLNDGAGTANTITVTVDNLTTSWTNTKGFFRTPAVLPSTAKLRIAASSGAALSAHTLYLDHLAMCEASQLYSGGPYVAVFSGATEFVLADKFTIAVANDSLTNAKWAYLLEKLFSLRSLGLAIPSDGSPTIADSYIA